MHIFRCRIDPAQTVLAPMDFLDANKEIRRRDRQTGPFESRFGEHQQQDEVVRLQPAEPRAVDADDSRGKIYLENVIGAESVAREFSDLEIEPVA